MPHIPYCLGTARVNSDRRRVIEGVVVYVKHLREIFLLLLMASVVGAQETADIYDLSL